MPRDGFANRLCALAVVVAGLCPLAASADAADWISPFVSPSIERSIHGNARDFDMSRLGHGLGSAEAFFGVDAESTASKRYLSSGLRWRSSNADTPFLSASAMRTEGEGAALAGGQTLMRIENRLDLGGRWFMPDLSTEMAQTSSNNIAGEIAIGRAVRIGLARDVGAGDMTLGYFQADPQFSALGSAIVAGDRGVELQSRQHLGDRWELAHDVRLHQPSALRSQSAVAQTLVLSRREHLTDLGRPWQLSAELGAPVDDRASGRTPLALQLTTQTLGWRDWRLDSSIGWYDASTTSPVSMPVDGALWQFSASRGLTIAGLRAQLSPTFALGSSGYAHHGRGARTGLNLGFDRISDHLDLSVNYVSAGWAPAPQAGDDMQMMLRFSRSTSAIMPGLRNVADSLRLPWRGRR